MNQLFKICTNKNSFKKGTVQVIDTPCGKGKTSWAIQHMNANPIKKYFFVTPFLTEVSRIIEKCPELNFVEPSDDHGAKSAHLKKLLADNHNIVTTHSLFTSIDEEVSPQRTIPLLLLCQYDRELWADGDEIHEQFCRNIEVVSVSGTHLLNRLILDS